MGRDELLPGEWRFRRSSDRQAAEEAASPGRGTRSEPGRHQSLTPSERVMRARMAAYLMHARHDGRETTAASHAAFMTRFLHQVDPEHKLPEAERRRRAAAARSAYFTRLAFLSARKRRQDG